ncbi:hypothetical protein VTJ83DRAFT_7594 [Remersonia thermophila]|uniref:STAS domain-containing protein n=1 Tax=Remersonia thermophila TaxID=72144 RepID=A0ABR4D4Z2_9PEZI
MLFSRRSIADVLQKILDIDPELSKDAPPAVYFLSHSGSGINCYTEPEPTVGGWLRSLIPTPQSAVRYVRSVFLFTQWLPRYNWTWLIGDSIAGLTVGFVVIPQAMAYALLAKLSPEYGLYTSFVGAAIYWVFGTSKDIVIGTTAVGSLLVGSVVVAVQEEHPGTYTNEAIAKVLSAVSGMILLAIGLLRLGWIIEFIPYISISAFVTAAAITIMATQFPTLMGITGVNTREATYQVIIESLKGLPRTRVDAAIGLSCIVLLYVIRHFCTHMQARQPARQTTWAIVSSMRLTFAMLLYTFISWLVNRNRRETPVFRIVGHIDRGFRHAGPPPLSKELISLVLPELPAILIILVIEHVAIAKSFGRTYGYDVIPSQEILAQGASNLIGTFVGGYACTGSFGASAVLSKAGVRTPLAGLFSALILLLALYALTAVFFYIPHAALAGLIIHAVVDLPTPPKTLYKYWRLSPVEFVLWWIGVLVAIFISLEVSIYVTIGISLALLLIRLARGRGHFLGRTRVYHYRTPARRVPSPMDSNSDLASTSTVADRQPTPFHEQPGSGCFDAKPRDIYLPIDHYGASNPEVTISDPYPGVIIYRFPAGFNYTNQAQHVHRLVSYVKSHTHPGGQQPPSKSGRLWSDPGPTSDQNNGATTLPPLRAVVLDCTAVDGIDITSVQGLVDARRSLERHACPGESGNRHGNCVQWHFAGLSNPWARRALAAAGFGVPVGVVETTDVEAGMEEKALSGWEPVYIVASVDEEEGRSEKGALPVHGVDRPFFHADLTEAVQAAVRQARRMEELQRRFENPEKAPRGVGNDTGSAIGGPGT